jgi:hypothetical protein
MGAAVGEAALPSSQSSHQPLNIEAPAADDGYTCKPLASGSRALLASPLKGGAVCW